MFIPFDWLRRLLRLWNAHTSAFSLRSSSKNRLSLYCTHVRWSGFESSRPCWYQDCLWHDSLTWTYTLRPSQSSVVSNWYGWFCLCQWDRISKWCDLYQTISPVIFICALINSTANRNNYGLASVLGNLFVMHWYRISEQYRTRCTII